MKIFIAISFIMLLILLLQNKYKASVLFTGLSSIYFILDLIKFDLASIIYYLHVREEPNI